LRRRHIDPDPEGDPTVLSSFPSPSSDTIPGIGVKYYGVMIALGVLVAVSIARKRWRLAGHDPDEVADIAVWAVPFGLVGARLYHVITDWNLHQARVVNGQKVPGDPWYWPFAIWQGGLGIPGGIFLGVVGGVLAARYYKISIPALADAMAPTILVAQAVGRLGNYFNQELYGRPSTLPWAVRIDIDHLPRTDDNVLRYPESTNTFQPTFLYEALWNLGAFGVLMWIDSKKILRQGKMLPAYVLAYFSGRLWVEYLRDDHANKIAGMRINSWVSLIMIAVGLVWLFWGGLLRPVEERGVAPDPWAGPDAESDGPTGTDGELVSVGATSSVAEGGEDVVGELGPEVGGPVAEGSVAEPDEAEPDDGVDPHEGP